MPYISLRILKIMAGNVDIVKKSRSVAVNSTPDMASQLIPVTHASSDDLESLFYNFLNLLPGTRGHVV
jgi:hypothetical protein